MYLIFRHHDYQKLWLFCIVERTARSLRASRQPLSGMNRGHTIYVKERMEYLTLFGSALTIRQQKGIMDTCTTPMYSLK